MSWTTKGPGFYERPLGDIEKSMVMLLSSDKPASREPILIHTVADFSSLYDSNEAVRALKDGWKALRLLKSPDIATTFHGDTKFYKVPTEAELDVWCDETFKVLSTDMSVHSAIAGMTLHPDLLPFCYLIPRNSSHGFHATLIMFISHWRSEATGCFMLVNQIFHYAADILEGGSTRAALDQHVLGREASLLTPSMEEVVMESRETAPEAQARVDADFANFYAHQPSVGFPVVDITKAPSHMKLHHRVYTAESTSQFVKACRDESLSVTAVIHALYIGAVWNLAGPGIKDRPYACMMPAQMRNRLPKSTGVHDQGAWCPAQQLLVTVPPGQDFFSRARHLRITYQRANEAEWLYEDMRAISKGRVDFFTNTGATMVPSALPWFSALGVLDDNAVSPIQGKFHIERLAVWCDFLSPGVTLLTWTLEGKLNIQFAVNLAYHPDEQIKQVIMYIEENLNSELGIKMAIHEAKTVDC